MSLETDDLPMADERADVTAARRGGDTEQGMDAEADPITATMDQALYWRKIYSEIVEMELIHCAYDRDARHSADDLLVHRPEFHGVEVWHHGRRIYVNLVGVEADG